MTCKGFLSVLLKKEKVHPRQAGATKEFQRPREFLGICCKRLSANRNSASVTPDPCSLQDSQYAHNVSSGYDSLYPGTAVFPVGEKNLKADDLHKHLSVLCLPLLPNEFQASPALCCSLSRQSQDALSRRIPPTFFLKLHAAGWERLSLPSFDSSPSLMHTSSLADLQ